MKAALLVALLALPPDLLPIAHPDLAPLGGDVARQLAPEVARFEELAAAEELPAAQLAAAYGEMGRLYLAYQLLDAARPCLANATLLEPRSFRWRYYLGIAQRRSGDLEAAAGSLESAHQLRPGDLPALLRLGEVTLELGRTERAGELLARALAAYPDNAPVRALSGRIAMAERDDTAAAEHFARALELQPEATQVHYLLAQAYRGLGRLDDARRHLGLRGPGLLVSPDPLIDELTGLADDASSHLRAAMAAFGAGEVEMALAAYGRAIEADPRRADVRMSFGSVLHHLGRTEAAVEQFRQALRLTPEDLLPRLYLADALRSGGAFDEAAAQLETILSHDPGFGDARRALARVRTAQGRPAEAVDQLARLLELEPWNIDVRYELAQALAQGEHFEQAAEELRRVAEADPQHTAARLDLGGMLARLGRAEDAAVQLEEVLASAAADDATRAAAHLNLARLHRAAGRYSEARRQLEEGLVRFPQSGTFVHSLARLLAACPDATVRDGERAVELAEAVFAARKTIPHAETLAMAWAEVGRFEEATRLQTEVIALARHNTEPQPVIERLERSLELYRQNRPYRTSNP